LPTALLGLDDDAEDADKALAVAAVAAVFPVPVVMTGTRPLELFLSLRPAATRPVDGVINNETTKANKTERFMSLIPLSGTRFSLFHQYALPDH